MQDPNYSPSSGAAGDTAAYRKAAIIYITLCVLLFFACLGLGYYVWIQREAHRELSGQSRSQVARIHQLRLMNEEQKDLLTASQAETEDLRANLSKAQAELQMIREKLTTLSAERATIEEQLAEFKRITKQFKKMINTGKLKVSFRNGRILLELPAAVLFPLGSADLSESGMGTIEQVAKILRTVEKRRFIVAGHTDNLPITSDRWKSNWDLSTARAVTVTEALIVSEMDAGRLGAAGFAETDPVATNENEKGRRQNRRIEIIVEPLLPSIENAPNTTE